MAEKLSLSSSQYFHLAAPRAKTLLYPRVQSLFFLWFPNTAFLSHTENYSPFGYKIMLFSRYCFSPVYRKSLSFEHKKGGSSVIQSCRLSHSSFSMHPVFNAAWALRCQYEGNHTGYGVHQSWFLICASNNSYTNYFLYIISLYPCQCIFYNYQ